MKKRYKVLLFILVLLVGAVAVGGVLIARATQRFETYLSTVEITPVDLGNVSDGTYHARVDTGVILVELQAVVMDHALRDITLLKHRNGQGTAAEAIIPRILREQRIDVDTVAGATYSSLVIQDALGRALNE